MSRSGGNLKPAHRGYRYQDIVSAYFLVLALVDKYDSVTIDEKQVEDDRFDDIEVSIAGNRIRRQIKSSTNATRCINTEDFTGANSSLRIDRLILTARQEPDVAEYRLCATWHPPEQADALSGLIAPVARESSIGGTRTQCFQLIPELIWPEGCSQVWTPLANPSAGITREEFVGYCSRFLIELELPSASTDLTAPGIIENAVIGLLADRVGVGRYPNQSRLPSDVAALAVSLATLARTDWPNLSPSDIEKSLELRLDFGRVAQSFPVDRARFYDRPSLRVSLRANIQGGGIHLVLAPPGSGKSWELTRLGEELANDEQAIVARHYCYLEPGDDQVERRITSDVFFGNLIAELFEAAPELNDFPHYYSADLTTLENALQNAVKLDKSIVLIVDGLDHIASVLASSSSLSDDETDIVEQLATLNLPQGVALVVGSQPGAHLQVLHGNQSTVTEHQLPPWSQEDTIGLARVLSVPRALAAAGFTDDDDITETLKILAAHSDGNPLYARYISDGLIGGMQAGLVDSPNDWLRSTPNIEGNIAIYYQHLYANISNEAKGIADIFGTIDFSISEVDLRQILPPLMHGWISQALNALSPILNHSTTQGGMRVFHESFRRFMIDELARQGRQLNDVLGLVILWLEQRGFFSDAKSFRFLLPLLRRAGRSTNVLDHVGTTFVSQSVSHAHPAEAIQRNLALAAEVAARAQNWPFLVRCSELRRMLSTCFDDGNNSWYEFWETYAQLHGAEALAERLLFDGKPTQDRNDGLRACLLVDDLGATAPWREYLDLSDENKDSGHDGGFDDERFHSTDDQVVLAIIHGRIRTGKEVRILHRVYLNLCGASSDGNPMFVRELAKRLARLGYERYLLKLATRGDFLHPSKAALRADFSTSLRLGVADELLRRGEVAASKEVAEFAMSTARTPASIMACVERGAPPESTPLIALDPSSIPIGVNGDHIQNATAVRHWIASLRLSVVRSPGTSVLDAERARVGGIGWYRCWLRYVIALAEAEVASFTGLQYDIDLVFSTLAEDVRPFVGKPRSCDVYALHYVIKESLARGLSLIRTRPELEHAIAKILEVSQGTGTRIDKEDGGPVPIGNVIDILMPYVSHPEFGETIRSAIATLVSDADDMGTYYATHATYTMHLAKVKYAAGRIDEARECWSKVGKYLTGYGWRKDITLFDIIDSASTLDRVSQKEAIKALFDLQPLIAAVLRHTDGRSTKRAPNAWLRSLLAVAPATAIELLARSILDSGGQDNWITLEGVKDTLRHLLERSDPLLLDSVWDTIPFKIEYDNAGPHEAKDRLDPLRLLFTSYPEIAKERIYRLVAEVTNNERRRNKEAGEMVTAVAVENGLSIRCTISEANENRLGRTHRDTSSLSTLLATRHSVPIFKEDDTYLGLLSGIRKVSSAEGDKEQIVNSAMHYLSYRLPEMVAQGDEAEARRIVRFLARQLDMPYSLRRHPLLDLAACLENASCTTLAAIAYVLGYTSSRGGGGWLNLGDDNHSFALHRAIELDRELALQTIADEIGYRLRHIEYGAGISRHLIERIAEWNEPEVAMMAWREAFDVIAQRLPLGDSHSWLASLDPEGLCDWELDEGIVVLLLIRLGEPQLSRKVRALSGLLKALRHRPESLPTALKWWMSRDTPISSLLLVLHLLRNAESPPFSVTVALQEQLWDLAGADCWGVAILAGTLLSRASLPVPAQYSFSSPGNVCKPSEMVLRKLLTLDESSALAKLSRWWNDLPYLVGNRFGVLERLPAYSERIRERLELAFGRDGKSQPPTPVMLWQTELFITALHTEMMGFKKHLWTTGTWEEGIERKLLLSTLPSIRVHVALCNSRFARPNWVTPKDAVPGVGELKTVADDDDRFAGWLRLGLVEHQFLNGDEHVDQPFETVQVFSGTVIVPFGHTVSALTEPFENGTTAVWWRANPIAGLGPVDEVQPLLTMTRVADWLGDELIIMPPEELHELCAPRVPGFGDALIWRDENYEPMLALRSWTVKRSQYDNEPDEIRGADLIVRPDLIEKLKETFCCSFAEVTQVS